MAFIIVLIIAVAIAMGVNYALQFSIELDSDKSKIINDGLIKELIEKATSDPSIYLVISSYGIDVGDFEIRKTDSAYWFPYHVRKKSLPMHARVNNEDWGYNVGYVRWLSKDWKLIKDLIKSQQTSNIDEQRKKLNLDK